MKLIRFKVFQVNRMDGQRNREVMMRGRREESRKVIRIKDLKTCGVRVVKTMNWKDEEKCLEQKI